MTNEERQEWLDGLKAGDEVAYSCGYERFLRVYKVDKRTASGWIVVGRSRFNSDGTCRGRGYGGPSDLQPVTDEIRQAAYRRRIAGVVKGINWDTVSLACLESVYAAVQADKEQGEPTNGNE